MSGGKLVSFLFVVLLHLGVNCLLNPNINGEVFRDALASFAELYNKFANRCDLSRQSKILIGTESDLQF